ncbi:twin-arginine translocase subunit TatC [bacterium]|nr:twin-arginine translocase subunit TatC [bacterium]
MSAEKVMPLTGHLAELRTRLFHIIGGLVVATLILVNFTADLFQILTYPLLVTKKPFELIGTGPADAFMVKLTLAIAGGVLLSLPYTFYQLWLFIAPGLHEKEKKFVVPFVTATSICFFLGVAFAFFIAFPYAFDYFGAEYQSIAVQPSIRINEYLTFVIRLLLVFGTIFELPVICYCLARLGLISSEFLIKHLRIAIVLIFILAAVLTPPDVVSQLLMAAPLCVIYALCIWIAKRFQRTPRV